MIAVLGDLHFGTKSDSAEFLKYQLDYLDKVIKYCKTNNIKHIVQVGDFFHSRKVINENPKKKKPK